ncbi:MAG: hypothetical protein HOO97_01035 [Sideroxydans sp.]|nr:hypothetical protein [Sideroxydans sp.]
MNLNQLLKNFLYSPPIIGEICSTILIDELKSNHPVMIGRFGSTEIKAVLFPLLPSIFQPFIRDRVFTTMHDLSGFFPSTNQTIQRFSDLMIEDMKQLDVLGSWRIEEKLLLKHFPNAKRVALNSLEPYLSENPWSEALAGKKVLVIHPFNLTIERQYNDKRAVLFKDPRVLPEFKSLETIKAVQTVAGQKSEFADWFEALDSMKAAIDAKDFDVAIIGCGAYGFPLAAHVKRMGKKAIHMGGATQLLFGIKGKRWDNHPKIGPLYNEYWVRPAPEDVPQQANKVEGGCYW